MCEQGSLVARNSADSVTLWLRPFVVLGDKLGRLQSADIFSQVLPIYLDKSQTATFVHGLNKDVPVTECSHWLTVDPS